ncbi:hypothetical protein J6590_076972, partial [Homalodisca vitripennis]
MNPKFVPDANEILDDEIIVPIKKYREKINSETSKKIKGSSKVRNITDARNRDLPVISRDEENTDTTNIVKPDTDKLYGRSFCGIVDMEI